MIEVEISHDEHTVRVRFSEDKNPVTLDEVLDAALRAWKESADENPPAKSSQVGFGSGGALVSDRVETGGYYVATANADLKEAQ